MKWTKKGLVFRPDGQRPWFRHSALQPTPLVLEDGTIRVFVGLRDAEGVSRVGFVDLDGRDPSRVLGLSDTPALDVGRPGTFDENGVVPSAVLRRGGELRLYYAGYQLGHKIRFTVFGGLAISTDDGRSFRRHSPVPVLERNPSDLFFRVAHSVLPEGNGWRIWYGGGDRWVLDHGRQLPVYDVRTMVSPDGIDFRGQGQVCLAIQGDDEHRLGRPYVVRDGDRYRMFYSVGTRSQGYRLGYAESADGLAWHREDDRLGLGLSPEGWDSTMMAYPSFVIKNDSAYLFYNGNDYGKAGFGYAVLESW